MSPADNLELMAAFWVFIFRGMYHSNYYRISAIVYAILFVGQ